MALVNTGRKERKEQDINPNSSTFGQFRWVDAGIDTEACPMPEIPVYGSMAISQIVFRNDCAPGYIGGSVFYELPAGHTASYISQEDANTLAQAYFDSTKQAYANANGSCNLTQSQSGGSGS